MLSGGGLNILGAAGTYTYENICFVSDHCLGDGRVLELVCKERGANGLQFDRNHDSWHVHHGQEELDLKEDVGHRRSIAVRVAQEEHEEESCG